MNNYLNGMKGLILIQIFFSLLDTIAMACIPYLNMILFDTNVSRGFTFLIMLLGLYVVAMMSTSVFQYISQVYEWKVIKKFNIDVKFDLNKAINKLDNIEFRKNSIGDYISMMENDIRTLNLEYIGPMIDIFKAIIQIIVYSIFLFVFVDIRIAIVILVASVFAVFIPKLTAKRLSKLKRAHLEKQGKFTEKLKDLLEGHSQVNIRTRDQFDQVFLSELIETEEKKFKFGQFKTFTNVLNGGVMSMVSLSAIAIVGYLLFHGEITIGAGVATLGYVESFIYPIRYILDDINSINSTKETNKRVTSFLSLKESELNAHLYNVDQLKCENVKIKLGGFIFGDFTFTFNKGKKYAIIGHSGSGKSTLLNALYKEVKLENGSIQLNDTCLKDIDISFLIMYIKQREHIFDDNSHNNITLFSSYDGQYDFNNPLYDYLYNIDECTKLSGGEKQLIAYARAKASNCSILLLDEPFSAMDKNMADVINKDLLSLENTVIHVTHRLDSETLSLYDAVLEIDNGQLKNVIYNTV